MSDQKPKPQPVPDRFKVTPEGIYISVKRGKESESILVCSPLEVIAVSRSEKADAWGRYVRFSDLDGAVHVIPISMASLATDSAAVLSQLLKAGLQIGHRRDVKDALLDFISTRAVLRNNHFTYVAESRSSSRHETYRGGG
jgi:hypothetical protein